VYWGANCRSRVSGSVLHQWGNEGAQNLQSPLKAQHYFLSRGALECAKMGRYVILVRTTNEEEKDQPAVPEPVCISTKRQRHTGTSSGGECAESEHAIAMNQQTKPKCRPRGPGSPSNTWHTGLSSAGSSVSSRARPTRYIPSAAENPLVRTAEAAAPQATPCRDVPG